MHQLEASTLLTVSPGHGPGPVPSSSTPITTTKQEATGLPFTSVQMDEESISTASECRPSTQESLSVLSEIVYEWSQKRLQDISSDVCGQYCITVLHWLFNDRSLQSFHKLFSLDTKRNDHIIMKMFKKITQNRNCNRKNLSKPFQSLSGKGILHCNQRSTKKYM